MAIADRFLAGRVPRIVQHAASATLVRARGVWEEVKERAPVVGRISIRRRSAVVLAPYRKSYSLRRSIINIATAPALALFCLIYGFFFGLTAPSLIVPFVVPILALTALIIWALPHQRTAPTLPIEILYAAFFVSLIVWPNYVAISLPGLPWITISRLIGLPLALLLLISLSVSPEFRRKAAESVNSIKILWAFMCGFISLQIITTLASHSPGASAQLVFNQQIYWTVIFVVGCIIFRDVRQVERYFALLCGLSIPIILLSIPESMESHVLWMNKIPKLLQINDPSVKVILTPTFRAGTNLFRVRTTFSTPLEEAEYLSLLTPFLLYFGFSAKRLLTRALCIGLIPIIFIAIRLTDCRLGVVGMLVSVLLYGVLWSIVRWRAHPKDLIAAATVYTYPVVFMGGIGAVLASHRLHDMVFGGSAQASSTAARDNQLTMATKAFMKAPWGYGTGQSGEAIGYPPGQFIAIDNHFIVILLEYGALGVIAWYGMFIIAIIQATRYTMSARYAGRLEARLLAPLAVELCAFVIIKWVHGGTYTHPIDFMILGMVSALIYNLNRTSPAAEAVAHAYQPVRQHHGMSLPAFAVLDPSGRRRALDLS